MAWTMRGLTELLWEAGPSTWDDLEFYVPDAKGVLQQAITDATACGLVHWRDDKLDLTQRGIAIRGTEVPVEARTRQPAAGA